MHLAPLQTSEPDSRAIAPAAAGDRAAFAELYEENFAGLFDFVVRIVRSRDLAADVVQATFARAWDEIRLHRELRHPKAWLYGAARNRAIDELRRTRWIAEEAPEYAQADPSRLADPQAVAEDKEMVDLVWSSAAALSPDDYSLLDLHVRRGFGAAELAETLELERGAVYTRLSRLRSSLEESVAATLLVRRGRDDCEQLAAIAGVAAGDSLTPELRRAVRAHVKDCETCSRARRRFVSPVELFSALAPVAALPGVRESIWQALPAVAPAGAASGANGAGVARRAVTRGHWAAGTAVVVAAAAVVAIVASAGPSVRDPQRVAGSGQAAGAQSANRPHATGGASRPAKATRRVGHAPKRAQSRPSAAPGSRTGRSQAGREPQSRPHHGGRHGPSGSTGPGPTGHAPAQPPAHAPSGQPPAAAPGAAAPPPTGDPAAAAPPPTAAPSPVVDPPAVVDDDHANSHHHHHGDPD